MTEMSSDSLDGDGPTTTPHFSLDESPAPLQQRDDPRIARLAELIVETQLQINAVYDDPLYNQLLYATHDTAEIVAAAQESDATRLRLFADDATTFLHYARRELSELRPDEARVQGTLTHLQETIIARAADINPRETDLATNSMTNLVDWVSQHRDYMHASRNLNEASTMLFYHLRDLETALFVLADILPGLQE